MSAYRGYSIYPDPNTKEPSPRNSNQGKPRKNEAGIPKLDVQSDHQRMLRGIVLLSPHYNI